MDTWLQDVSKDAKSYLKPVFDIVATVKTIQNIKSEAFAVGKCDENLIEILRFRRSLNVSTYREITEMVNNSTQT